MLKGSLIAKVSAFFAMMIGGGEGQDWK